MTSVKTIILNGLKYFRETLLSDTPTQNDSKHALSLAGAYNMKQSINTLDSNVVKKGSHTNFAIVDGYSDTTQYIDITATSTADNRKRTFMIKPDGVGLWDNTAGSALGATIVWGANKTHQRAKGTFNSAWFHAYGYVTNASKDVIIVIPMTFDGVITSNTTLTVTAVTAQLRPVNGGYVGGASDANLLSGATVFSKQINLGYMAIGIRKNSGTWTYNSSGSTITNNTPIAGGVSVTYTLS